MGLLRKVLWNVLLILGRYAVQYGCRVLHFRTWINSVHMSAFRLNKTIINEDVVLFVAQWLWNTRYVDDTSILNFVVSRAM